MDENDLLVDYPDFAQVINNQDGAANVLDAIVGEEEAERVAKVLARCTAVMLTEIETAENQDALFEEISSSVMVVFMFGVWLGQSRLAKLQGGDRPIG